MLRSFSILILSLFLTISVGAQEYFVGIPVDTVVYQSGVLDKFCYPDRSWHLQIPGSNVTGVDYIMIFSDVTVPNSAYITGIGTINSGDTIPIPSGTNDLEFYFPVPDTITYEVRAVGTPTICGEVHGCSFTTVWTAADCMFQSQYVSYSDSCMVNCTPGPFVPPPLPDLTDPCEVSLSPFFDPDNFAYNNCGNFAQSFPSPSIINTTGLTVVTWSYYRDTLLMTATQNVIIGSFDTISPSVCSSYTSPSGLYTWTSSGTYSDTIQNYAGCDSVITIYLTVGEMSNTINPVDCNSYTSPSGNYTWTTSGTYLDTIPAVGGCDSIITVNLTIGNTSNTISPVVCNGTYTSPSGNYIWVSSGTYQDTIPNAAGCDSIILINLSVGSPTSSSITENTCGPYTSPSGNYTWQSSGVYQDTIPNSAGCDSVITINLNVFGQCPITENITACQSYTSPSGNYTWTTSGTYLDTVITPGGCEGVVITDLIIEDMIAFSQSACDSYTSPSGNYVWTTSGTYQDSVAMPPGFCDMVTVYLTIYNSSSNTISPTACSSYTSPSGNYTWTSSGTYLDTIPNLSGCDSVITINLTIANVVTGTDVQNACISYTWIDGNTYTSSTNTPTYTYVGGSVNGCDSIVTLDLTIGSYSTGTDIQTACDSYTWIDSNTYSSSTNTPTYTYPEGSVNGCDSIVTLDLTITNSTFGTDVISACDSCTWIDGNTYTSSTSTPTYTLYGAAANGCDSIVTLDLTITNSTVGTDVIIACESYTWIDGNTYTTSTNTPTWTLSNSSGCDSVVTLDLTINNANTGTDIITACESYTWIDGNTYTTSNNSATWILTNSAGCDSTVTLDLTINYSSSSTISETSCDIYLWSANATMYTSSGTYTTTLTNAAGCDSIVTLDLTITNSNSGTDVITACDTYTWIDGNTYTSTTNTPTWTLTNSEGCDSIVTLNLTIDSVDVSVTDNSPILIANDSTATSYEWIYCAIGLSVPGETSATYEANLNGSYAVIITNGVCVDTSECYLVLNIGFSDISETDGMINIYPNPSHGNFIVSFPKAPEGKLEIIDATGRIVYDLVLNDKTHYIMEEFSPGVYTLVLRYLSGDVDTRKFIIE